MLAGVARAANPRLAGIARGQFDACVLRSRGPEAR